MAEPVGRTGRCAATLETVECVPPGNVRRPAAEAVPVAAKPWQVAGDFPPDGGGNVLGTLPHGPAKVAEQTGLDMPIQRGERCLVPVLGPSDRRAQGKIVGRNALITPSPLHDASPHGSVTPGSVRHDTSLLSMRWPLDMTDKTPLTGSPLKV